MDLHSRWEHCNPVHVKAGPGSRKDVSLYAGSGSEILLVTTLGTTRRGTTDEFLEILGEYDVTVFDQVTPNPALDEYDEITEKFRGSSFSSIAALGGGSVLDAAKVLSVTLGSTVVRPLHMLFREKVQLEWEHSIPVIAIPTTAGTGSEVTPFATIWDTVHHKKYSLSSSKLFPAYAMLDPELTVSLPEKETLYTAMDALSHALESLWNTNRTACSEAYALHAVWVITDALPDLLKTPASISLRGRMQYASMLAGQAISQTRTALAHAISYPLTSRFGVPHGLACSFTLSGILRLVTERTGEAYIPRRLADAAGTLLKDLCLQCEVDAYVSSAELSCYTHEMFSPERAGNFILAVTEDDVKELLAQRE